MQKKFEKDICMIDRLLYYVVSQGDNFNRLAQGIGVSNSYFSKMKRNKGSIGADIIEKILEYYDNLNAEWLLRGNGNMLKSEQKDFVSKNYEIEEFNKMNIQLIEKDAEIKELKKTIKKQKILIRKLEEKKILG